MRRFLKPYKKIVNKYTKNIEKVSLDKVKSYLDSAIIVNSEEFKNNAFVNTLNDYAEQYIISPLKDAEPENIKALVEKALENFKTKVELFINQN